VTEGQREAGTLAILGLVPSLLFADILLGINAFFARDVMHYYYPAKKILREIVLGGHFPYWNPWFSAGQPMAANPEHEIFYPLTWLILLPDFTYAFQLLPLLHILIATFGMYALLRSMELGRFAAMIGALTFGIGGVLCSLLVLFPCLFSIAWLPLTCLYARRFLLHHQRRDFALAAFFLGLQLIVGEPVTAFQSGVLLGCYALYRAFRDGGLRTIPKRVGVIALISIAALLLAAVQVLPTFDHLGDTARGQGIAFDAVRTWSTPPIRFAEMLYPHILGRYDNEGSPAYWGSVLYGEKRTGFLYGIYCGLAIAVLAIAGVVARVRGWPLFLGVSVISGLVAAGHHTPLLRILYDSGIGSITRFPEKFLMMGIFALIVFGAHVLDAIVRGEERARKAALGVTIAVTVCAFGAAIATWTPAYASVFRALFSMEPLEASLAFARGEWMWAGLRGLILAVFFVRVRTLPIFGLFILIDVAAQVPHLTPRIPSSFYRETPPSVRAFPPDRDAFRIFHLAEWTPNSPRARTYRRPSAEYFWILRNGLSPHIPAAYDLRTVIDGDFDETNLRPERDFTSSVFELATNGPGDWLDIAMSMSNAWYLGMYRRPEEAMRMAGGWTRDLQPVRFIEGGHHSRYYFASQVVSIRDRAEFVRRLRTQRFSRQVAFIHEAAFAPAKGVVHEVQEWTNGARMEVETTGRAYLVMSVTPHKYWYVTIDGKPATAIVTNIGYQGVVVPPGRHVVEMRYRNPLIAIGAAISAVTLLALVLLFSRRLPCPFTRRKSSPSFPPTTPK
jgi:hypothetical protein